jgi:hypothetical protein
MLILILALIIAMSEPPPETSIASLVTQPICYPLQFFVLFLSLACSSTDHF